MQFCYGSTADFNREFYPKKRKVYYVEKNGNGIGLDRRGSNNRNLTPGIPRGLVEKMSYRVKPNVQALQQEISDLRNAAYVKRLKGDSQGAEALDKGADEAQEILDIFDKMADAKGQKDHKAFKDLRDRIKALKDTLDERRSKGINSIRLANHVPALDNELNVSMVESTGLDVQTAAPAPAMATPKPIGVIPLTTIGLTLLSFLR